MYKFKVSSVLLAGVLAMLVASLACGAEATATPAPQATSAPAASPTAVPKATVAPQPTATAPAAPVVKPVYGGNLRVSYDRDPQSLDPATSTGGSTALVGFALYSNIVQLGRNGEILPELAQSWDVSADGKTITFRLVKGVQFHDGTPLNAQAIKYNLDRIKDPAVGATQRAKLDPVEKIVATDDSTLTLTLKQAWRPFLTSLAEMPGMIVSPAAVDKTKSYVFGGTYGDFGRSPVGSGAFRFVEWRVGQRIVIEKNPKYWEAGKPYLDRITVTTVGDPQVNRAMMRTNELDLTEWLQPDDIPILRNSPDVKVDELDGGRSWNMLMATDKAPFNNKSLRQAISYATNRDEILKVRFDGVGRPGYTFTTSGWASNPSLRPINFDPQKAKEKLVEAGYPNGVTVQHWCKSDAYFTQLCETLQAQLKQVNINVELVMVPTSEHWGMVAQRKINFAFTTWRPTADPHLNLQALFQTGGQYTALWAYSNAEVDKLLDQAGATYDLTKAKAIYDQVQTLVALDVPFVTVVWAKEFAALNKKVQNYVRVPDLDSRVRELWIEK